MDKILKKKTTKEVASKEESLTSSCFAVFQHYMVGRFGVMVGKCDIKKQAYGRFRDSFIRMWNHCIGDNGAIVQFV